MGCRRFNRYAAVNPGQKEPLEVDWITGAFLFMARECFQILGGFDEAFFMYYEDTDLCRRLQCAGYHNYYLPRHQAIHLHGISGTPDIYDDHNRAKVAEKMSSARYVRKYHPDRYHAFVRAMRLLFLVKSGIFYLKKTFFGFFPQKRKKNAFKMRTALMVWRNIRKADH
jgi:GT2 family glycosyltransferase